MDPFNLNPCCLGVNCTVEFHLPDLFRVVTFTVIESRMLIASDWERERNSHYLMDIVSVLQDRMDSVRFFFFFFFLELPILGGLVYYKFFLKYWTSYREVFVDQNFDPEWMVLETWWWLHSNINVLGATEL